MSKKTNIHQELKKLRQNYLISKDGHHKRIAEQKKIVREAKKCMKMHRLLIKQSRTQYKLNQLEAAQ